MLGSSLGLILNDVSMRAAHLIAYFDLSKLNLV